LNKSNVVDVLTLVATEIYSLLKADEFSAPWPVLGEFDGFVFKTPARRWE
jgi:hypothetical protein